VLALSDLAEGLYSRDILL